MNPQNLAVKALYPRLLHYWTTYSFPSPNNIYCPLIPKLSSLIVSLVSWISIHILVSGVRKFSRLLLDSLSSSEADSQMEVLMGSSISLPLRSSLTSFGIDSECQRAYDMKLHPTCVVASQS
ncbi:hypothetical protein Tco_0599053 [Tanacetum coccineum]